MVKFRNVSYTATIGITVQQSWQKIVLPLVWRFCTLQTPAILLYSFDCLIKNGYSIHMKQRCWSFLLLEILTSFYLSFSSGDIAVYWTYIKATGTQQRHYCPILLNSCNMKSIFNVFTILCFCFSLCFQYCIVFFTLLCTSIITAY